MTMNIKMNTNVVCENVILFFQLCCCTGKTLLSYVLCSFVDNHASILLRMKNTCGIQKKVATVLRPVVGLNKGQLVVHTTAS